MFRQPAYTAAERNLVDWPLISLLIHELCTSRQIQLFCFVQVIEVYLLVRKLQMEHRLLTQNHFLNTFRNCMHNIKTYSLRQYLATQSTTSLHLFICCIYLWYLTREKREEIYLISVQQDPTSKNRQVVPQL